MSRKDVDTLFPYYPEQQWALKDKKIDLWMISIVSLTNPKGGIIGQIEYHEAMKRLEPYIIASCNGWVLVRAMTHDELDNLFVGLPRTLV